MAFDKVIDSAKLDADITTVADAIREKSGVSGKMAFPNGMADAVRNISSGGVELPELDNPGTAGDLEEGKQLIDADGNVVEGTLREKVILQISENVRVETDDGTIEMVAPVTEDCILRDGAYSRLIANSSAFGNASPSDVVEGKTFTSAAGLKVPGTIKEGNRYFYSYNGGVVAYPEDGALVFDHTFTGDCYYRAGEVIQLFHSDLGDAIAEDVTKGKTFTTAAGVKMEGTMEPGSGGGLPAGITEIQTGSWTQATNDSSGSFTIPHGCSKTPRFIIVNSDYATSGASYSNAVQIAATVCNDDGGSSCGYQLGGASQANTNTTNVKWDDTNMTFTHWNSRRWRQGNTYTWYAICVDNWEGL